MKAHIKLWQYLFKEYTGRGSPEPGAAKTLELNEWSEFITEAGLINEQLAAREIPILFNCAMFTQVDELTKKRHLEAH